MEKFVPADKLSKKKRRELNSGRRKIWTVRPQTKRIESKKHYSRKEKYPAAD